jgi:hypothetical protein
MALTVVVLVFSNGMLVMYPLQELGYRWVLTLMVKLLMINLVIQSLFLQRARQLPLEQFTMMKMALTVVMSESIP